MERRKFSPSFLFVISCLFMIQTAFGQSELYKMIDSLPVPETQNYEKYTLVTSVFPCDINEYLSHSFIGISDPGLDSTVAYEQAYLRALQMYALHQGIEAKGMSDYFKNEKGATYTSKYQEMYRLQSNCKINETAIQVVNKYELNSGEVILFLVVDSKKSHDSEELEIDLEINIFNHEIEEFGSPKSEGIIEIRSSLKQVGIEKNASEHFKIIHFGKNGIHANSFFSGGSIDSENLKFFYNKEDGCKFDSIPDNFGTVTYEGLWPAIIQNMFSQLTPYLNEYIKNVKSVGDRYNNELMKLDRGSGWINFCLKIKKLYQKNNFLKIEIYEPQKN